LCRARLLLLAGQPETLLGEADDTRASAEKQRYPLAVIYSHIHSAAAWNMLGQQDKARAELRKALDKALPDGLLMPFVENSRHILPVLRSLKRSRHHQGIQRILELTEIWNTHIQVAQGIPAVSDARPPLTAAERKLLRLAANGESFKMIAARQGITYGRVKNIFSDLYKRFSVHGRDELLRRLTEQGLTQSPGKVKAE
jgi:LuxR family maltose regulon positive regulatory protein